MSVQSTPTQSFLTKTENGNLAIDTVQRSIYLAINQLMHGSEHNHIVTCFTKAVNDALAMPESDVPIETEHIDAPLVDDLIEIDDDINEISPTEPEKLLTPTMLKQTKLIRILALVLRLVDFRNGGHGRRLESRIALITVCSMISNAELTKVMLKLWASHHGRWNNLNDLEDELNTDFATLQEKYPSITPEFVEQTKSDIVDLFIEQIKIDIEAVKTKQSITMCAKWIPTESKSVEKALVYARRLFPRIEEDKMHHNKPVTANTSLKNRFHRLLKSYRLTLKPVRDMIPMIERELCNDTAHLIDPSKVPGVALQRSKRALENLASLRSKKGEVVRSDNPHRIQCAQNFKDHAKAAQEAAAAHRLEMDALRLKLVNAETDEEKQQIRAEMDLSEGEFQLNAPKVHGANTVFVHELVDQYLREGKIVMRNYRNDGNVTPDDLIEAQFENIKSSMTSLQKLRVLFVLDTSGSMTSGAYGSKIVPLNVGMGLTALLASTASPAWRHKAILFSSNPYVIDCSKLNNNNPRLCDYIHAYQSIGDCSSTDVQKTIDLIANISGGIDDSESLDMIVFLTDNQFDAITSHHTRNPNGMKAGDYLKSKFEAINKKVPLCCFWNLSANYTNCPAEPSDNGVIMMSGFSSSMLESFGETIVAASTMDLNVLAAQKALAMAAFEEESRIKREEAERLHKEAMIQQEINTFQVMLDFLDGKFSDPLREALSTIGTGLFSSYEYVKVPCGENENNVETNTNIRVYATSQTRGRGSFRGRSRGSFRGRGVTHASRGRKI